MSEAMEEGIGADASPALSPGKSVLVDKASCSVEKEHSPSEKKDGQGSEKLESGIVESTLVTGGKGQDRELPLQRSDALLDTTVSASDSEAMRVAPVDTADEAKMDEPKNGGDGNIVPPVAVVSAEETMKTEKEVYITVLNEKGNLSLKDLVLLDDDGNDSGTEDDQSAFMHELENFFKEKGMKFKPPKFYGEGLNCLKLWRAVFRLGGYEKVTSRKLWKRVGESFKAPKTCTAVSWTFRGFYEKALLDYEKDKIHGGESLSVASPTVTPNTDSQQASGSSRPRRESATRAMQGWSLQRSHSSGEAGDPTTKDKRAKPLQKREKQLKSSTGSLKRKKPNNSENAVDVVVNVVDAAKSISTESSSTKKPNNSENAVDVVVNVVDAAKSISTESSSTKVDIPAVDMGPPADWVKVNVQRSKDCFEVYVLVPGLLREEVKVRLDPAAGRLIISGAPENLYNPWGVTPFKKALDLPSRIDAENTSAEIMLHGKLYVRVPLEQPE